jgi:short-subunit dehydrogenase
MNDNKVFVITGASRGIGEGIALILSSKIKNINLFLIAKNIEKLNQVKEKCIENGANVEICSCDVSNVDEVNNMAKQFHEKFNHIDVLINNAGIFKYSTIIDTSIEMFDEIIATNLRSVFLISKVFIPLMINQNYGDIFNVSSIAGLSGYYGGSAYSASKFGMSGLSKTMRIELKNYNIKVCCVYPGAVYTDSWAGTEHSIEKFISVKDISLLFYNIYELSRNTVVEEIILRPILGDL